jgi:hypothetical protein
MEGLIGIMKHLHEMSIGRFVLLVFALVGTVGSSYRLAISVTIENDRYYGTKLLLFCILAVVLYR